MAPPLSKNLDSHSTGKTEEVPPASDEAVQDRWQTIAPKKSTSSQTAPALEPFGDYELLQEIARGGMGVVYKALQRGLERVVALKMILSGPMATEEDVQRFCLEARAAANLDHPNIVQVYEIGQKDNQHYFTMAFIEGDSLAGLIKNQGLVLSFPEAALTLQALADAIQYAHEHGIIHRDLKPENVLVDKQGRPRLTDFGLAKRLEVDSCLTASGQIMGTPSYMAPEQAQGKPTTSAVDVYSLGAILYFLLTRRPPFAGKNLMETLVQVAEKDPIPPRQLNPSVPAELEAICLKCLQKDPAKRYATAGALAADLQTWFSQNSAGLSSTQPLANKIKALAASGGNGEPRGPGIPETVQAAPGRRRSVRGWVAGVAVLACVVGIGVTAYLRGGLFASLGPSKDGIKEEPVVSAPEEPARVIHAKGFTRPEKLRRDFDFKVTLNGGIPGPNGERSLIAENTVSFTLEMKRDAYVRIWTIDPDGEVMKLFPNEHEPDSLLHGGKTYTIPGKDSYDFAVGPSTGIEHYWVQASTQPGNTLRGQRSGPYEVFRSPDEKKIWEEEQSLLERERSTYIRANKLKPGNPVPATAPGLAEEIFAYRVK